MGVPMLPQLTAVSDVQTPALDLGAVPPLPELAPKGAAPPLAELPPKEAPQGRHLQQLVPPILLLRHQLSCVC